MGLAPVIPFSSPAGDVPLTRDLLERFGRYTAIHTTSDPHVQDCPSTAGQWDLARVLVAELGSMGVTDVVLTEHCYVIARVPASAGVPPGTPALGILAHLDTSSDTSGKDVHLVVHRNYDGGVLVQPRGPGISPAENPGLLAYRGRTILSSDGSTLLGADDKAGIAEIMTAVDYLLQHPEVLHGELEIIFTPDEEIGRGVDRLDTSGLRAKIAYTLDGDDEGTYNDACFNAWAIEVVFQGRAMHPGYSRGRMINATTMAAQFIGSLPRTESPEATDGLYGFYSVQEVQGTMEEARVKLIVRDFDQVEVSRRVAYVQSLGRTLEEAFPGSVVKVNPRQQYCNMRTILDGAPPVVENLRQAIRLTGMEPHAKPIRGGTDGARLTEKGILTPNIFAGGQNFHSNAEWVALDAMERAVMTILNLVQLWVPRS